MNKVTILGVSGISGAGKTTLVKALGEHLQASCLYWDDFDEVSEYPDDYVVWFQKGSDYTKFNYEQLANALRDLKRGKSVYYPTTNKKMDSTRYIIVDAPLGKAHAQTAQYIDLFIHIDIPLDIALARRLLRDYKNSDPTEHSIIYELEQYLTSSRPLFEAESMSLISNSADYIIDGTQAIEKQLAEILNFINYVNTPFENNIKIEIVEELDETISKKMTDEFVKYESENGIQVNYKKFSLIILERSNVIGVLNAYTAFSEIYVDDLWIDKVFRGKGYGRALLLELEHRFKGKGFNNINLVTSNFQAPEFYKKCGFKLEYKRINEKNPKLTKFFFVKFFGEDSQMQGILKS